MDAALRKRVRTRAGNRCEYCRLRQEDDSLFTFHVEHVVARQHGGSGAESNLALACYHCNRHKGPNLAGLDPETDTMTRLYDPRRQDWDEHFRIVGAMISGRTPVGHVPVSWLLMASVVGINRSPNGDRFCGLNYRYLVLTVLA